MEKRRAVDTLATGEYRIEICSAVYYKIQCLEPSVTRRVHEVDHPDAVLLYVTHYVGLCKLTTRLSKKSHYPVRAHFQRCIHKNKYLIIIKKQQSAGTLCYTAKLSILSIWQSFKSEI